MYETLNEDAVSHLGPMLDCWNAEEGRRSRLGQLAVTGVWTGGTEPVHRINRCRLEFVECRRAVGGTVISARHRSSPFTISFILAGFDFIFPLGSEIQAQVANVSLHGGLNSQGGSQTHV